MSCCHMCLIFIGESVCVKGLVHYYFRTLSIVTIKVIE